MSSTLGGMHECQSYVMLKQITPGLYKKRKKEKNPTEPWHCHHIDNKCREFKL